MAANAVSCSPSIIKAPGWRFCRCTPGTPLGQRYDSGRTAKPNIAVRLHAWQPDGDHDHRQPARCLKKRETTRPVLSRAPNPGETAPDERVFQRFNTPGACHVPDLPEERCRPMSRESALEAWENAR
eukprot:7379246-Prymnesium_polylepis.1